MGKSYPLPTPARIAAFWRWRLPAGTPKGCTKRTNGATMNLKNLTTLLGATLMLALAMTPTASAEPDPLDILDSIEVVDPGYIYFPDGGAAGETARFSLWSDGALADYSLDVCAGTGECGEGGFLFFTAEYTVQVLNHPPMYGCLSTYFVDPTAGC